MNSNPWPDSESPRQVLDYNQQPPIKPKPRFTPADIIQIGAGYLLAIFLFAIGVTNLRELLTAGGLSQQFGSTAITLLVSLLLLIFLQLYIRKKRHEDSRH